MATISQTEFLITAKDLASQEFQKVNALQKQVVNDSIAGTKKLGSETNNLTRFIQQQRSEQRQQNFLFRQGKDAVGAIAFGLTSLSGAMGGANSNMRALNSSLQQGFIVFQGLDFILAGINPTIGITVAIIGGLTAAFATFANSGGEDLKKVTKNIDALAESIGNLRAQRQDITFDNKSASGIDIFVRKAELQERISADKSILTVLEAQLFHLNKQGASYEEILSKQEAIERRKVKLIQDEQALTEFLEQQKQILEEQIILRQKVANIKTVGPIEPPRARGLEVSGVKQSALPDLELAETGMYGLIKQFEQLGTTAQNVNSLIIGSTQNAAAVITDAFFGATNSIQEFFETMIKNIVRMMAEQLVMKGILSLLGSVFGFAGALFAPNATPAWTQGLLSKSNSIGGGTAENLGSRTITINVSGDTSEASTAEVRRTMRKIQKAVFTERYE